MKTELISTGQQSAEVIVSGQRNEIPKIKHVMALCGNCPAVFLRAILLESGYSCNGFTRTGASTTAIAEVQFTEPLQNDPYRNVQEFLEVAACNPTPNIDSFR